MKYQNLINELFEESIKVVTESKKLNDSINDTVDTITKCLENNNKVVIFGNGGSAADAQHVAAEFIGRYLTERESLPAIALTTDTSILTAISNDYGFEKVFSRQCDSLVKKGDVVIAISTSGKSSNVINGILTSKRKGALIVILTGANGENLKNLADNFILIPSKSTPRIQEAHRIILHIICELVEKNYSEDKKI